MKKTIYIILGCIFLLLGAIGAVLPILPTVPFLLLTVFFFARSSEKLHTWITNTDFYRNNLESWVERKAMTLKTKLRIIITATVVMGAGFVFMDSVIWARILLACVWMAHLLYFVFGVKTIPDGSTEKDN